MWGLKQGIDFTGGTLMAVRFVERPSSTDVQRVLDQSGVELGSVVIQPVAETDMQFRLKPLTEEEHAKVFGALSNAYPTVSELRFDAIGPVVGEELRRKSFQGLAIVLIAIMAYVAYVFRKVSAPVQSWKYGLVTIVALLHDVVIPTGLFVAYSHFTGAEIDLLFVSAILAILGYSVHDTIVVFDRVRESLKDHAKGTFDVVVGDSLMKTMSRSINTSLTTFITLLSLYFIGGETTKDFAFLLLIGILVGTYSSIFLASPLLVVVKEWQDSNKK
jgi:preprotein translocase subunit SecF